MRYENPGGPPQPPPRGGWSKGKIAAFIAGGFVILIVIAVIAGGGNSGTGTVTSSASGSAFSAAASAPAEPSFTPSSAAPSPTPAAPDTVTFIVTGSTADVTYGAAGSNLTGTVPMRKSETIPDQAPVYYSISAQLQGGGQVSCEIQVDGKTISKGQAEGGYNIAQCEIGQDPINGGWQDDNSG